MTKWKAFTSIAALSTHKLTTKVPLYSVVLFVHFMLFPASLLHRAEYTNPITLFKKPGMPKQSL